MIDIQQIAHSLGKATKGSDGWYSCICPAHNDKNPSLSIKESDNGKLIVKCYTGCSPKSIFQELENRGIYSRNSHNPNFHKSSPYNPNNNATEQSNKNALQQWENLLLEGQSDYLKKKGVKNYGFKYGKDGMGNFVAAPYYNIQGELCGYQRVYDNGEKKNLAGSSKTGCFHVIGNPPTKLKESKTIYITEGISTGASVYEALEEKETVICTMGCDNFNAVISRIKKAYPTITIIIAGDDDQWSDDGNNAGRQKAEDAAKKYGCHVVFPKFQKDHYKFEPTDFNDLLCLEGIEAVQDQLSSGDSLDVWPDPLPIKAELLRVKPFDDRLLPEPLATFVKDCAFRMQCPPDYIGAALITMLSSLIGASCAVKPKKFDDWVVIPNLWGGIIGEPSTLKTPAITEAFSPLHKLEKEANKEYEENFKEWDIKNKTSKIRENLVNVEIRDQMKKDKSFTDQRAQQYYNENKPQQHPKPIRKRYKINDATIEKLHEILSENPRGVMVFRDELVGFLNLFNKQGHETDRSFYLEAWNGFLPVTVDRIQRGTVEAENTCVSIFGSTQPDKIKGYLYKSLYENDNDGFLQRFQLLVYPDPLKQWQYVDQAPAMSAQEKYCELAAQIGSGDFLNFITELQEVKGKQCFSFDDEAQDLFIIWLTEHENRLRALERADDPIVIQHLSKYRKLMPALALIFHQINIATGGIKTGKITKASAVRAICWCEYLESHARRIYGMALDIGTNAASVLTRKIEQGNLGTKFYLRDIYRKQWSFLKDSNSAEAACEELVKAHWLKEISTEPSQGQKIRTEYIVNPKIIITKKEEIGYE